MRKKFVHILWGILIGLIIMTIGGFLAIWNGWIGYMPDMEDIQNPISKYSSQVFSADGQMMGTYASIRDNRITVGYSGISPHLIHALVATEDERYYEHSGIDFKGLGRAIVKRGLMGKESAGGGSTITQQLAKQLYSKVAHSKIERLFQKPIEWVISIKLEKNFTKEEILVMYLNYFDFLYNAIGVKNASMVYFSKDVAKLSVTEAATLIGLCKNPSFYNPVRYKHRSVERRNTVLSQMQKAGYLTMAECEKYMSEPLKLDFQRISTHESMEGCAPYFREYLRQYMMAEKPDKKNYPSWKYVQYYIDSLSWEQDPLYGWCNKNTRRGGKPYNINTDGLRIYTTIDTRMQRYAEEAVREHLSETLQPAFNAQVRGSSRGPFSSKMSKTDYDRVMNRAIKQSHRYQALKAAGKTEEEIQKDFNTTVEMKVFTYNGDVIKVMTPLDSIKYYKTFLRSGFVSMEPKTGAVKAYVGGQNYEHFQYDMAMVGRRQVGSTIKPYLYSLAMENGFTPCDQAPNRAQTYYEGGVRWTPRNGSRARYGAMVTLKWGLQQSNNWISAYLMSKFNPMSLVDLLHKYGINNPNIKPVMALCLGPCEVTVGEMVSAYTAFVNHGIRCAPYMVTRIEDSEGNILADFQPRFNEVISESSSFKMLELLQAVVDGGTASRVRGYGISGEIGGKTGTTNDNADGWFMGVTPELVSGCWVGGEDRDIHFLSTRIGQGAHAALPIWAKYMKKVYGDASLPYSQSAKFDVPKEFDSCSEKKNIITDNSILDVYE